MLEQNKVKIVVNDLEAEYEYWTDISITSELNTVARSFAVGTTAKLPQSSLLTAFAVGDFVQVWIGDDLVLTGYIDATPISYDGSNVTASVTGRSRTEDLIDCSPAWTGFDFSDAVNGYQWAITRPVGAGAVDPEITIAANQFKNVSLKQAVAQLIAPYGIHLCCQLDNDIVNGNITTTIKDDDTILKALQNLVGTTGLFFMDDEYGNLVIVDENNRERCSGTLSLSKNVLSASASFDGSQLFQRYRINSSQKGSAGNTGKALQEFTDCIDADVERFRFLRTTDQTQNGTALSQKISEAEYRRAQFYKTSYTVQGWREFGDTGALWQANKLVTIEDDILNNSQEMLITKVTFTLDDGGMLTNLECVPPAGYKLDAQPSQEPTAVASSGSNNQKWSAKDTGGLDLVRKGEE